MGSSSSLDDVFGNSNAWNNHARLSRLLISGGTRVLRELFDFYFPPETLASTLGDPKIRIVLTKMRRNRLILPNEWDLLFPRSSNLVSSESWNISLLLKLLRHFSDLPPPASGWDRLPNSSDFSLSADVARLKYYGNIIAHLNLAYVGNELNDGEFKSLWEEIQNALLRIVSHYAPSSVKALEEAIDELRVAPLDEGHEFREINQRKSRTEELFQSFQREWGRARVEGELVGERSGPGAEDGNGTETEPIAAKADVEAEAATTTPPEILASSPEALKAYKEALIRGKTKNRRVLITVVGPARAGKTSLLKSLKGEDFDQEEDSTDGLVLQKVFCKPQEDSWCEEDDGKDDLSKQCIVEFIAQRLEDDKSREGKALSLTPAVTNDVRTVDKRHPNQKDFDNESEVVIKLSIYLSESMENTSLQRLTFNEISQVPKEMQDLLERRIKDIKNAEQRTNESEISLKTLDFAGQQVYEVILPLFISSKSIYMLVYSLENELSSDARLGMKRGNSERKLENSFQMTHLDTQEFWLSCISSYTKKKAVYVDSRNRVALPPVFVVCTHADVCKQDPKKVARELCKVLTRPENPYSEQVLPNVYTVDNTLSGNREVKDESAKRLKKDVEELAKLLPQVNEDIPISWLRFEEELSKLVEEEQKKYIDLEEARRIAINCNVDTATESIEFTTLLNYLHDLKTIIYFEETKRVFIDTQWLVDMFIKVITVLPFEDWKEFAEHWRKLENEGILQRPLVEHLWTDIAIEGQDTVDSLLLIMEKFSLICPWRLEEEELYLVPCMLYNSKTSKDVEELLGDEKSSTMVIRFKSVHLPMGIFPRLVVALAEHGKKEWPKVSLPKLRPNFCRMFKVGQEGMLDICIFSGIRTICVTIVNESNIDDLSVTTFCQSMRKLLAQIFATMQKTRPRVESMELEFGIHCPVCTKSKKCNSHERMGCKRDSCVHFVGEEELKLDRPQCHEHDTNKDTLIRKETYSQWFPKTDIRSRGSDETHPAETEQCNDNGISGNTGCQDLVASYGAHNLATIGSTEMADKLAQYLQLDRLSPADPPADIQEKCRNFCQQLKRIGRHDAIREIRKTLPCGMTGPLLDDNMLFEELDFKTRRDLSRALCRDDLWKCLASGLQVTGDHFGYFERQKNPAMAMLEDESNSGLKVAALYDILVQCDAAALADKYL